MRSESCSVIRDIGNAMVPCHRNAWHNLILSPFWSRLQLCKDLSVQAKNFCPGNLFQGENIFKNYYRARVKYYSNGIRGSLGNVCCGCVLLGVILSHVISEWCLHCSASLQDTLGVIAWLPDNLPSLSLCMWKGKMLVALEASPRAPGMHPKHNLQGDSLSWLTFLWSFIETAV